MNNRELKQSNIYAIMSLVALLALGVYFIISSFHIREFSSEQLTWDYQWLNLWSLIVIFVVSLVWFSGLTLNKKSVITIISLSLWGTVAIALILKGTPFPWNAYGGDQQFRTAMIRIFMNFTIPTDFYYKGLPPFYPPLFFWVISLIGRLFALEPHFVLKLGSMLVYTVGPFLTFKLWRKIVTSFTATCIVCATFLIQPISVLTIPHEFLAMSLFIPWWIGYVEGIDHKPVSKKDYLFGGVIGGAIFMMYYYMFFVGILFMIGKSINMLVNKSGWVEKWRYLGRNISMLSLTALFSSIYWLPLMISMFQTDSASAQSRWFRIWHATLLFGFNEFNWFGLLSLFGLLFAVYRWHSKINRLMIQLIVASISLVAVGYLLGNVDFPILYLKSKDFIIRLSCGLIGLAVSGIVILSKRSLRISYVVGAILIVLVLFSFNSFTNTVNSPSVKKARTSVPVLQDLAAIPEIKGKVFLTDFQGINAFIPAYKFIGFGEHASHPAGEYRQRLSFLAQLQYVKDKYLFWLVLRYNRWIPIDYIALNGDANNIIKRLYLSDYPDGNEGVTCSYKRDFIKDTNLFTEVMGGNVFKVIPEYLDEGEGDSLDLFNNELTKSELLRLSILYLDLNSDGKVLFKNFIKQEFPEWDYIYKAKGSGHDFNRDIALTSVLTHPIGDSIEIAFTFQITGDVKTDYRYFFHLYNNSNANSFVNMDFAPDSKTSKWRNSDFIIETTRIPNRNKPFTFSFGLFDNKGKLGKSFYGKI